jgi:hypothetical protein
MTEQREWLTSTEEILADIRGLHEADHVRTLAMDLSACAVELAETREALTYWRRMYEQERSRVTNAVTALKR